MAIQNRNYRSPSYDSAREAANQASKTGMESLSALLLQGVKGRQESAQIDQAGKLKELLLGKQHELDLQGAKDRATEVDKLHEKYGNEFDISLSKEGASLHHKAPKDNSPAIERHERRIDKGREGLSKRYEKVNNFNSDIDEIDRLTNKDGKGGILTNPDAKLNSTGPIKSMAPDWAMGLAELIGVVPKGTSEERKALQRLQIDYQQAKSGMRVTEQARAQEAAAMGRMISGDPALAAKAIRSLGKNIQNQYGTIQSGYNPEVVERVHNEMGDPSARYESMYVDAPEKDPNAPPAPPAAATAPTGTQDDGSAKRQARIAELKAKLGKQ